jgi:hypothetical protein
MILLPNKFAVLVGDFDCQRTLQVLVVLHKIVAYKDGGDFVIINFGELL